jgi:hypothetical protein
MINKNKLKSFDSKFNFTLIRGFKSKSFKSSFNLVSTSYSVRNQNIFVEGQLGNFSFINFKHFITAMSTVHSLDARKSVAETNMVGLALLYYTMHLVCSTRFAQYLVNSQKQVLFPGFLINCILKISLYVRKTNKLSSLTEGKVTFDSRTESVLSYVSSISLSEYRGLFEGTQFSGSINVNDEFADQQLSRFKAAFSEPFVSDDEFVDFDSICDLVPRLCSTLFYGSNRPELKAFTLSYSATEHMGVLRFRGVGSDGIYLVNQTCVAEVPAILVDYFCFFLAVFRPVMKQGFSFSTVSCGTSLSENDLPLDVGGVSLHVAFIGLISANFSRPDKSRDERGGDGNSHGNGPSTLPPNTPSTEARTPAAGELSISQDSNLSIELKGLHLHRLTANENNIELSSVLLFAFARFLNQLSPDTRTAVLTEFCKQKVQ